MPLYALFLCLSMAHGDGPEMGRLYAIDRSAMVAIVRVYEPVRRVAYIDLACFEQPEVDKLWRLSQDFSDATGEVLVLTWWSINRRPSGRLYRGHKAEGVGMALLQKGSRAEGPTRWLFYGQLWDSWSIAPAGAPWETGSIKR